MFRVNRQTDYAVRVVLALSKKPQGTRISTSEIGREMLIPPALLQRIVAELASGGFIETQAGRDGGHHQTHGRSRGEPGKHRAAPAARRALEARRLVALSPVLALHLLLLPLNLWRWAESCARRSHS